MFIYSNFFLWFLVYKTDFCNWANIYNYLKKKKTQDACKLKNWFVPKNEIKMFVFLQKSQIFL